MTFIIGLTGSIASGKSTLSGIFRQTMGNDDAMGNETRIYDADACVHQLYQDKDIIAQIAEKFPQTCDNGVINRQILGNIAYGDKVVLQWLESIFHPILKQQRDELRIKHENASFLLYDIPLLFEKNIDKECDVTICCYCDDDVQYQRLKQRNMADDKINAILAKQMPVAEKIKRSHINIKMQFDDLSPLSSLVIDLCQSLHHITDRQDMIALWQDLADKKGIDSSCHHQHE